MNDAEMDDGRRLMETLATFARSYHTSLADQHQHQLRENIARIAIDLARMAGNEPEVHLSRAARLLTDAGTALIEERERPEREANACVLQRMTQYASDEMVPAEQIYAAGKREGGSGSKPVTHTIGEGEGAFQWKPYASEKGFRNLLVRHFGKLCDKALPTLNETLFAEPPQLEKARAFLVDRYYFDDECSEWLTRVATPKDANEFLSFWRDRVKMMVPTRIIREAQAGVLGIVTLRALAMTRGESCSNRSQSAAVAKKAKARMHDKRTGRRAKSDGKKNR
ncbi:MAG: hypothetical protein E6R03_03620 [Hyphomicrobiaceae bacterium]|nr:MAG: hypothetical protein E6R03_03620 [Hyphomicrobiaceae bacterium]